MLGTALHRLQLLTMRKGWHHLGVLVLWFSECPFLPQECSPLQGPPAPVPSATVWSTEGAWFVSLRPRECRGRG